MDGTGIHPRDGLDQLPRAHRVVIVGSGNTRRLQRALEGITCRSRRYMDSGTFMVPLYLRINDALRKVVVIGHREPTPNMTATATAAASTTPVSFGIQPPYPLPLPTRIDESPSSADRPSPTDHVATLPLAVGPGNSGRSAGVGPVAAVAGSLFGDVGTGRGLAGDQQQYRLGDP